MANDLIGRQLRETTLLDEDVQTIGNASEAIIGDNLGAIPAGARRIRITVLTSAINIRVDGTAPTDADGGGNRFDVGDVIDLTDDQDYTDWLTAARAIRRTTDSKIWIEWFD